MITEIITQANKAEILAQRAQRAVENVRGLRSGDRVFTPLVQAAEFQQGQAPSRNLVYNVPADADFWAYRFSLFPYCKVVDPQNGTPDEITYRPTSFTGQSESPGAAAVVAGDAYTDFDTLVDGRFAFIFKGDELQNIDIPMAAAYSQGIGKWLPTAATSPVPIWGGSTSQPGGFVFDIPFFIPRGKNLTVRLTPTYLGVRSIIETIPAGGGTEITRQHKYKLIGVLEGEKKVQAFR